MEIVEGIESRKSLRAFKSTPVPEAVIKDILRAASKSPSYTNTQPWEVAVVSGKKAEELAAVLLELAASGAKQNLDIPLPDAWPTELAERAKTHGMRRFQALGIERADESQRTELRLLNFKFYGAPSALFLFQDSELGSWSMFDMGLFTQSLILAAHSFGVGTCLQASLTNYPEAIHEFLDIPKTKRLVLGISLGYPDLEAKINSYQSTRIGLGEFVHWHS